jgi:aspartyl-tRNA(Asn)/glutamyl-tRNA(Gln) amidotransferase subunit C
MRAPEGARFLAGQAEKRDSRRPGGRAALEFDRLWEDVGMAISRDEVLHVARLARLALTDEEVERLGAQLNAILEAVGKVGELDLEGVEPTAHPLDLVNVWAEDEPRPSLPVEEALNNAPDREGGFFKVPPA